MDRKATHIGPLCECGEELVHAFEVFGGQCSHCEMLADLKTLLDHLHTRLQEMTREQYRAWKQQQAER